MPKRRITDSSEENENIFNNRNPEQLLSEDSQGEDLFEEDYEKDYREMPELDSYDVSDVTDEIEPLTMEQVQFVNEQLDEQKRRTDRLINPNVDDQEFELNTEQLLADAMASKDFMDKDFFISNLTNLLIKFLSTFHEKKYVKEIKKMCSNNQESLYVSFEDLNLFNSDLARLLNVATERFLQIFDKSLVVVVVQHFPNYLIIKPKLHVRLTNIPVLENIRNLRNEHINTLIRVTGVVTRRTGVFPLLSLAKYTCHQCKAVFGPFTVERNDFKPNICLECQSKGPFSVNSIETIYKDFQKITIQEIPGTVPPGRLPRHKEVLLFYDLIDSARPGEEVEVIGIYKNSYSYSLNIKNGYPVFFTVIKAITVIKKEDEFAFKMTDEDVKEILKISKHPNIKNIILNSIAPAVYGHKDLKRAISLAMFSGVQKIMGNHTVRGDINVLMLGDPGTAKSQLLRYVETVFHRAVLSSGQGASSVGLTASVKKDSVTGEWTLEGGALVLADRGICLIDEFDKMNDGDRTSIHEAMEQQSISISKAGIVASLNARCGVIAAANPTRGRYNSSLTFGQNVNLSDPIISRFDILCVVKDVIDQAEDERMGRFIIKSHAGSSVEEKEKTDLENKEEAYDSVTGTLSQEFLKKYILYARNNVKPILKEIDLEKITNLYSDLRKESISSGGIPITARHIESIVRMSESFCRMGLRSIVSQEDIDQAISVVLDSFIGSQKYSVMKNLKRKFRKYLENKEHEVLIFILNEIYKDKLRGLGERTSSVSFNSVDFERKVKSNGLKIDSLFYDSESFKDAGYSYVVNSKRIIRNVFE
ncbi:MCM DNA helicase complex subunit [Hamiltosporidium tvaerminnensis]|nr:MCM DNA helicase complex subunit [Hamiltosporidium tvaerminnensis]